MRCASPPLITTLNFYEKRWLPSDRDSSHLLADSTSPSSKMATIISCRFCDKSNSVKVPSVRRLLTPCLGIGFVKVCVDKARTFRCLHTWPEPSQMAAWERLATDV